MGGADNSTAAANTTTSDNSSTPAANTTTPSSNTTTNSTTTNGTKGKGDAGKKAAAGADFGTIALIVLGVAVVAGGGFFAYKHFNKPKPEGDAPAEGAEGGVFEDDLYMKVDVESTLL